MQKQISKRGMGVVAVIGSIAGIIVLGSIAYFNMKPEEEIIMHEAEEMIEDGKEKMREGEEMMHEGEEMMEKAETMMEEKDSGDSMKEDGAMMKEDGAMMEEGNVMEEKGDTAMEEIKEATPLSFAGKRLAGTEEIPLLDFNEADYKKALESDKLIALFFYASWCPTCRIEFPKMEDAFDEFTDQNVVGFRVNYKDSSTSDFEKELAKEFGVGYQHTKVFVKNGERILKSSPQGWSKDEYINNINDNL